MKKWIALLLAAVLCLSLCACGSKQDKTPVESEASAEEQAEAELSAETKEPENSQIVLHLNEAVEFGNFEFKIIDVRLKDSDGFSINYSTGAHHYGGPSVVVTYSLKNIGKSACSPTQNLLLLNYADGYTFLASVYINGKHPNIFEHGGVNSANTLDVLSSEQYYLESFTVSEEVLNNSDEPLYLTLAGDNDDKTLFRFDIRPIDDAETEALYQQAISLMDEGRYKSAYENLTAIGDYKDAKELILECCVKFYNGYEYLQERKDDFKVLTGEEIQSMLIGTWETVDGETWIFSEDGTLDPGRTKPIDGSKVITTWSINADGRLELGIGLDGVSYEIREIYPNGIMLFTNEGKSYSRMWKVD